MQVIDVSNPAAPSVVGSVATGTNPFSVYVSGRYAYVTNSGSNTMQVIDIHGAEISSLIAHSAEIGNLQIRNDIILQGELQTKGAVNAQGLNIFKDGAFGRNVKILNDLTVDTNSLYVDSANHRAGFGTTSPAGKVGINQTSTTAAIPVLKLTQADVSEEFIRYVGSAAVSDLTQSIVAEASVSTATRAGFVKVYVQDDGNQITDQAYFVPVYTLA